MLEVIQDISQWQILKNTKLKNLKIGFVPTMGALHQGHLSLIQQAKKENDIVLVSIYVNPTQFNDASDLQNYPKPIEQDMALLKSVDCDFLLLPKYEELYPDNYRFKVSENSFSNELCGAHRPGHFDGVLSVVMKLLNIAGANKAYFGLKDFQQYRLIQDMAEAYFLPTEIIGLPILREADGLAMSSRNLRLTAEERKLAAQIYACINKAESADAAKSQLTKLGFKVDYVEDKYGRRLVAAHIGAVRLIDNVKI